jgi:retron-type reverse transcriptase
MKTHNHLYPEICSLGNLREAARKASLGKRGKPYVDAFRLNLERELWALREELVAGSYAPGAYRTFWITDPKRRLISAAPFRDRVVHHALCNVVEPLWERRFVSESFANRKGFGVSKARDHFGNGIGRYPWVLRCDFRKFFPSMDHEILKRQFRRVVSCRPTLALLDTIVDASNPQEEVQAYFAGDDLWTPFGRRHGLPLGNQTSQFFANVHLDPLDHFIKETLRCRHYVRYVDDLALFGKTREELAAFLEALRLKAEEMRLVLHPRKTRLHRTGEGITFLGIHYADGGRRRLPGTNVRRARLRLRRTLLEWQRGVLTREEVGRRWAGWRGHALQGGGLGILAALRTEAHEWMATGEWSLPGGARRRLEQPSRKCPLRQSQQEPTRQQEHG